MAPLKKEKTQPKKETHAALSKAKEKKPVVKTPKLVKSTKAQAHKDGAKLAHPGHKTTAPKALKPKLTRKKEVIKKEEVAQSTHKAVPKTEPQAVKSASEHVKPVTPAAVVGHAPEKHSSVASVHPIKQVVTEKPQEKKIEPLVSAHKPQVSTPKPTPAPVVAPVAPVVQTPLRDVELQIPIAVKDLAIKLQQKPSVLIKSLMGMGVMAGINQMLDEPVVEKVCKVYGCGIKKALGKEELALQDHNTADENKVLKSRWPIVTFMGHVDHGKTSLLDAIRKTKVAEGEHGGITQHIGAYRVVLPQGEITFLDTPGHEAFTAMRARGASITDIVVLVVAADDGIMPQTQEAIDHARAAGVPIIVAVNKIDKQQADLDRVKKQLSTHDLTPEDWGGKTITVGVSAKTGQGIDTLLEMILLEAQMLELKANPERIARGVVLEAKMSKGRGPVATLLVQNGTLHLNQNILVGNLFGKIRAMFNDRGMSVTFAGPSIPVEVLGISGIPQAGEQFFVIQDEKQAKELAAARFDKERQSQIKEARKISLEDLHAQIEEGKIKELKLILKSDVNGSLEAIKDTLSKLNVSEIKLEIIHSGVGNINSSDIILASASNALILGFNLTVDERAKELMAQEGVEVRTYNIIYELANDIKAAVEGMLEPKYKKIFLGRAEVRKMFKLSRSGTIAGCFVLKGKIMRNSLVNVMRNGQSVHEGKLSSLKRFKDDVREVAEGFECGMAVGGYDQLFEGDIIEAYTMERIARTL